MSRLDHLYAYLTKRGLTLDGVDRPEWCTMDAIFNCHATPETLVPGSVDLIAKYRSGTMTCKQVYDECLKRMGVVPVKKKQKGKFHED